jgi:ribonuclease VapC
VIGGPDLVLDASALLAYLRDEPGAAEVEAALRQRPAISAVNWAEVLSKLADFGYDSDEAAKQLSNANVSGDGLTIWPFDERFAQDVARFRNQTRRIGLSLGDRACLALGMFLKVPVFTADRRWNETGIPVTLRLIR